MIAAALLVALAAAPSPSGPPAGRPAVAAAAAIDPALRDQLAPLLGAIDRPVPAESWRRLPPGARAALEALASDPGALNVYRARALEGVEALGGDGALHRRLAEDGTVPYPVRFAALRGLGRVLPPAERGVLLGRMLTQDPDVRIRAAAAGTLSAVAPATACPDVLAQVRREAPGARLTFRGALEICEPR